MRLHRGPDPSLRRLHRGRFPTAPGSAPPAVGGRRHRGRTLARPAHRPGVGHRAPAHHGGVLRPGRLDRALVHHRCRGVQRAHPGLPAPGGRHRPALGGDVEGYSGDGILFRFGWPQAHATTPPRPWPRPSRSWRRWTARRVRRWPSGWASTADRPWWANSAVPTAGPPWPWARRSTSPARLQGVAEPGTVVASAATIALVEGRFDVTPLGPLQLRGVTRAGRGLPGRAAGPAAGPGSSAPLTGLAPLVGRADAVATLAHAGTRPCRARGARY